MIDSIFGDIFVNQEAERKFNDTKRFVVQNMKYAKNTKDRAVYKNRLAAGFIHIYDYIIREQRLPRLYK